MNKILFIVGPTGTGKTALALKIAKKINGEIISADSRQVYTGMDIGTGKDIPVQFKIQNSKFKIDQRFIPYYSDDRIRIWGLDLVEPDEEFSVADYVRFAVPVIQQFWQDKKLPMIVGGTGLYIRALTRDLTEIFIPQNKKLRLKLHKLNVDDLQKDLKKLSTTKFNSMNESDGQNPRRLVRAIEIEEWKLTANSQQLTADRIEEIYNSDKLMIGLTADKDEIFHRIEKRVDKRVKQGIIDEIQSLLNKGYRWDLPAFTAIGYDVWKDYFIKSGKMTKSEQEKLKQKIIQKWKLSEHQYAKRQLTWFKKEPRIKWIDINKYKFLNHILKEVEKWYNR